MFPEGKRRRTIPISFDSVNTAARCLPMRYFRIAGDTCGTRDRCCFGRKRFANRGRLDDKKKSRCCLVRRFGVALGGPDAAQEFPGFFLVCPLKSVPSGVTSAVAVTVFAVRFGDRAGSPLASWQGVHVGNQSNAPVDFTGGHRRRVGSWIHVAERARAGHRHHHTRELFGTYYGLSTLRSRRGCLYHGKPRQPGSRGNGAFRRRVC
jgi:hypothetical protein